MWRNFRTKDLFTLGRFRVPSCFTSWPEIVCPALVCFLLVRFAPGPILHCTNSGGELVEEHMPWDCVCIMIAPRLKLEGHGAETSHRSSLGHLPRKRTKHGQSQELPRQTGRGAHAVGQRAAANWSRSTCRGTAYAS